MSEVPLHIAGTTCLQFSHLLVTLKGIDIGICHNRYK